MFEADHDAAAFKKRMKKIVKGKTRKPSATKP